MSKMNPFFVFLVMIALIFWSAFVFKTLWGWFIHPLGMPLLSLSHAIGLTVMANLILGTRGFDLSSDSSDSDSFIQAAYTTMLLLIGWLAHVWGL